MYRGNGCGSRTKTRPNRTAASRREQYARAEARRVGHLLKGFAKARQHRGGQLSRLGLALQEALSAGGCSSYPKGGHFKDFQRAAWPGFGEDAEIRGQAVPGHEVQHDVSEGAGKTPVAQTSALEGLLPQGVDLGISEIHLSFSETKALVSELARKIAEIDANLDRLLSRGPRLVVPPGSGLAEPPLGSCSSPASPGPLEPISGQGAQLGSLSSSSGTLRASASPFVPSQASPVVRDVTSSALEGEIVARELVDSPLNLQLKVYRFVRRPRLFSTPAEKEEMHKRHFEHCWWCSLCGERKRTLAHKVAEATLRAQALGRGGSPLP